MYVRYGWWKKGRWRLIKFRLRYSSQYDYVTVNRTVFDFKRESLFYSYFADKKAIWGEEKRRLWKMSRPFPFTNAVHKTLQHNCFFQGVMGIFVDPFSGTKIKKKEWKKISLGTTKSRSLMKNNRNFPRLCVLSLANIFFFTMMIFLLGLWRMRKLIDKSTLFTRLCYCRLPFFSCSYYFLFFSSSFLNLCSTWTT